MREGIWRSWPIFLVFPIHKLLQGVIWLQKLSEMVGCINFEKGHKITKGNRDGMSRPSKFPTIKLRVDLDKYFVRNYVDLVKNMFVKMHQIYSYISRIYRLWLKKRYVETICWINNFKQKLMYSLKVLSTYF